MGMDRDFVFDVLDKTRSGSRQQDSLSSLISSIMIWFEYFSDIFVSNILRNTSEIELKIAFETKKCFLSQIIFKSNQIIVSKLLLSLYHSKRGVPTPDPSPTQTAIDWT